MQGLTKLRSGALQFTIFIAAIIALLLLGVVLLISTHRFFLNQSALIVDNIQLAGAGIEYAKAMDSNTGDTLRVPYQGVSGQEIRVSLSRWGIFEKAFSKAAHKGKQFSKCALLGTAIPKAQRPAVYLQETFKPLMVAGTTEIKGLSFLPQQGIRPGNIAGNSYYGRELVYGQIRQSKPELPILQPDLKNQISHYLRDYYPQASDEIILRKGDNLVHSFMGPTKGYYSGQAVILDDTRLYGNIIIRSHEKIVVKATADLKDVILVAPFIVVEDNVHGSFQAIADKGIKVGKDCRLMYPSALILAEEKADPIGAFNPDENKITLGSGSTLFGSIAYLKSRLDLGYLNNIFIAPGATVKGEIYCQGNLELRGNVIGSVYTAQFLTSEQGTVFVNHLYNAVIRAEGLPYTFGGILMENKPKSVMQWLY